MSRSQDEVSAEYCDEQISSREVAGFITDPWRQGRGKVPIDTIVFGAKTTDEGCLRIYPFRKNTPDMKLNARMWAFSYDAHFIDGARRLIRFTCVETTLGIAGFFDNHMVHFNSYWYIQCAPAFNLPEWEEREEEAQLFDEEIVPRPYWNLFFEEDAPES